MATLPDGQMGPIDGRLLSRMALIQASCILEVCSRKPGNASPGRPLGALALEDLLLGGAGIAPVLAAAVGRPLGVTILEAAKQSRAAHAGNANLGILLLLAPMAAVPDEVPLYEGLPKILSATTVDDAVLTYEAIRVMEPGGLGEVENQDIRQTPTITLKEAMELSAKRDGIARWWSQDFRFLFSEGIGALGSGIFATGSIEASVVLLFLHILARFPDTLIERKYGTLVAAEVSRRAAVVLAEEWPRKTKGIEALRDFDSWLRANRYNPGTTADFLAATIYGAFRQNVLSLPLNFPFGAGAVC